MKEKDYCAVGLYIMKKILFIEDESALQKALSSILKKKGYEPLAALDGEIGLRVTREQHPDIILLDLVLPKKDGFEVLKELKGDPATAKIPVIVLTNLEGTQDVERALELGAMNYLVKTNYRLEEVTEKIDQVLSRQ